MLHARFDARQVALPTPLASAAPHNAPSLAGRVTATRDRTRLAWVAASASAMGVGIWSLPFVGTPARPFLLRA
jgi:NO-binding membrane sensor protein with MHYT domain